MNKNISFCLLILSSLMWISLSYAETKSESRTLQVHVNVEPIFVVQVTPRTGGDTVEFGTVKRVPEETVETKPVQVDIAVLSNLGVPYQVSQAVTTPLVNEEGQTLPLEDFLVQADETVYGNGKVASPEPVRAAEQVLFESNSQGDTDTFTANYFLKIPPTQAGGDYQTSIVYTIATKE